MVSKRQKQPKCFSTASADKVKTEKSIILTRSAFVIARKESEIQLQRTRQKIIQHKTKLPERTKENQIGRILDCFIWGPERKSAPHEGLMTNPKIDRLK